MKREQERQGFNGWLTSLSLARDDIGLYVVADADGSYRGSEWKIPRGHDDYEHRRICRRE